MMAFIKRVRRYWLTCVTLIILLAGLTYSSCSKGGKFLSYEPTLDEQNFVSTSENNRTAEVSLDEVLTELDSLQSSGGMSEPLFARLKSELRKQLTQMAVERFVEKAPGGEDNQVTDLQINDRGGGSYLLTWSYRNNGDYNQDGTVNIGDVLPLAQHFHESVSTENEWIDGSGDRVINIVDVSALARNFFSQCKEYVIRSGPNQNGPFDTEIGVIDMALAGGEGRKRFEFNASGLIPSQWAIVVPRDGAGNEGIQSLPAMVPIAQNQRPNAILNAIPLTGDAPLNVDFDASESSDPDGTITQYRWDFEGDATFDETSSLPTIQHEYVMPGEYRATVEVTDDRGATDTASILITVTGAPPQNQPPVAVLTASPVEGFEPLYVDFNAGGSTDPDGTIVEYRWDYEGDGTFDETTLLPSANFEYTVPGTFNATVEVSDDKGATDSDSVEIRVNAKEPAVINSVSPLSGMEGISVKITADVSGTPPFNYNFSFSGGTEPLTGSGSSVDVVEFEVLLVTAGTYSLSLTVSNMFGESRRVFDFIISPAGDEWSVYTVPAGDVVAQYSSLAVVGGKPAIAFYDFNSQDLFYAYSANEYGTSDWQIYVVDYKGMGLGDVGQYCSLAEIADGAGISYFEGGIDANLKFAYNSNPDGSGEWKTYRVDVSGDSGFITSLAEELGRPAIGYFRDTLADPPILDYRYAICDNSDGSGNWFVSSVSNVDSYLFAEGRVLSILDGRPAVSFYNWGTSELQFAINEAIDGTGDWDIHSTGVNVISLFVSMTSVNGLPMISYRNFDSPTGLEILVNSASDGSGGWSHYVIEPDVTAYHTAILDVNGYPAVAYSDSNNLAIKFAICDTSDGSGNWLISVVDGENSPFFPSMAMVGGRPAIAYCATDTGELKFAIRNY